ncbi:GNAT family N-acetyltransferase [Methyloraptor flagellatus]|jgi:putative hemolysin|uniref:L-ornithine N(alpha)-acyltransferase n=1 Tax=Methyloraptor flagellatus TaxID=3162530 RepID=A0AAU7X8H4_9HYPH
MSARTATAAATALKPLKLITRMMPQRHLPAGRIPVLPGIRLPAPVGPLKGSSPDATLGRIGSLEVRLARTVGEVKRAQELRYQVFYEEMSAIADAKTLLTRRDADAFDAICDHILVLDHDAMETKPFGKSRPKIVGTYRVLRQSVADRFDGFYTANEYDLAPLFARKPDLEFLELGRSCVLPPYRTKRTVELLWHGIWTYVLRHRIDVMIGCASLEGTDPRRLALPLSFLHHTAGASAEWAVRALPGRYVDMNRMGKESLDMRQALHALPPLVKGYLRLGAMIGDGAVVDHQFGTTDVCVIMPVAQLSQRHVNYYGADAGRHAA